MPFLQVGKNRLFGLLPNKNRSGFAILSLTQQDIPGNKVYIFKINTQQFSCS